MAWRDSRQRRVALAFVLLVSALVALRLCADEVHLQNGDRYLGKVLALDTNTLVLHSDVLGTVRLPRGKVALIALGSGAPGHAIGMTSLKATDRATTPLSLTNGVPDLGVSVRSLGADTNMLQQIQAQLLGSGGVEANQKFKEMLAGYMTGKLTVSDIWAQAQAAADQLKKFKGEFGDEAGGMLDGYLAILEKFLGETNGAAGGPPAANARPTKTKTDSKR